MTSGTLTSIARRTLMLAVAAVALVAHSTAWAHPGLAGGGFAAGFAHPWSGVDHMLAMVAVGLWAAQQGGRKVWILPLLFVAGMGVGAGLAWAGIELPWVEGMTATSVVVLGCLVAFLAHMPLLLGGALVMAMALFHGHAHGTELGTGVAVTAGFVLATLSLHALGVAAGLALGRSPLMANSRLAFGLGGAIIAVAGIGLLVTL
jgi:urease accessory protein